jgi:succinate dehydrogenase hydrophobic anchor subunit
MHSRLWICNLIAGMVVAALLGWHMAFMHLHDILSLVMSLAANPLAWENVVERGQSVGYAIVYVLFLGAALFHGFYGLRTILTEYWQSKNAEKVINVSCWVAGGGLFAIGSFAAISFYTAAPVL